MSFYCCLECAVSFYVLNFVSGLFHTSIPLHQRECFVMRYKYESHYFLKNNFKKFLVSFVH